MGRGEDVDSVEHRGHESINGAERIVKVAHDLPAGGPRIARRDRAITRHHPAESRLATHLTVRAIRPRRWVAVIEQIIVGVVLRRREQRHMRLEPLNAGQGTIGVDAVERELLGWRARQWRWQGV
jgi:hypothetical protein